MPRNSQGLYTLPAGNPVVPNTLIEANWANPTMDDIAAALTGSLPRDGSAPMTGPLTLACGCPHAAPPCHQQGVHGAVPRLRHRDARGGRLQPWLVRSFLPAPSSVMGRRSTARPTPTCSPPSGRPMVQATPARPSTCLTSATTSFVARRDARAVGSKQAASFASHVHPLTDPGHTHTSSQAAHSHAVTTTPHTHVLTDPGHAHGLPAYNPGYSFDSGGSATPPLAVGSGLNSSLAGTNIGIQSAAPAGATDSKTPAVTVVSSPTGIVGGAAGGAETRAAELCHDLRDQGSAGFLWPCACDRHHDHVDAQMISVDNTNPVVPELVIHSNVAFGTVKLDAGGKVPLNQMPTSSQQLLGYFDASGGQNPSEAYPTQTFNSGDTYIISVSGSITVFDPVTLVSSLTPVIGGQPAPVRDGQREQPDRLVLRHPEHDGHRLAGGLHSGSRHLGDGRASGHRGGAGEHPDKCL